MYDITRFRHVILFSLSHDGFLEHLCCATHILTLNSKHVGNLFGRSRHLRQSTRVQNTVPLDTRSNRTSGEFAVVEFLVHHLGVLEYRLWKCMTRFIYILVGMEQ